MSGEQLPESTAHILIVDDLPDHLAFAGTILWQQGYLVHAATSGRAALAFLEKRLPDLTQAAVIMFPSRLYAQSILRVFRRICALRGRTRRSVRHMRSWIASVRLCRTI